MKHVVYMFSFLLTGLDTFYITQTYSTNKDQTCVNIELFQFQQIKCLVSIYLCSFTLYEHVIFHLFPPQGGEGERGDAGVPGKPGVKGLQGSKVTHCYQYI